MQITLLIFYSWKRENDKNLPFHYSLKEEIIFKSACWFENKLESKSDHVMERGLWLFIEKRKLFSNLPVDDLLETTAVDVHSQKMKQKPFSWFKKWDNSLQTFSRNKKKEFKHHKINCIQLKWYCKKHRYTEKQFKHRIKLSTIKKNNRLNYNSNDQKNQESAIQRA